MQAYIGLCRLSEWPFCMQVFCWSILRVGASSACTLFTSLTEIRTVFNYVSDGYTLYAASALSAMNVCRNSLGAAFPLFGTQVYDALGIHGAGSLVAGIATALSVVPFLALAYGNRLRSRSRFAKELARLEAAAAARA